MCSNEISETSLNVFFRQHGVDRQEISMGFFTVGRVVNPGDDHCTTAMLAISPQICRVTNHDIW